MTKFLNISVDDTLGGASPSDETVSSQKALKTYIDGHSTPLPSQSGQNGKFLTTDGTSVSWASVPSDSLKANTDLSNLISEGKNIGNWSTNVSNCLTKVPNDIKLELNNGTLTLKNGSYVYIKIAITYTKIPITLDESVTESTNGSYFAFYKFGTGGGLELHGKTEYTYDTIPNGVSCPLAEVTVSGGVISSIDYVFNGFGYIGSTIFSLPSVHGLAPNGRNTDGTLNNTSITDSSVRAVTVSGTNNFTLVKTSNSIDASFYAYDEENNYIYRTDTGTIYNGNRFIFGKCSVVSGVITSFDIKTVFHAVDYSDIANLSDSLPSQAGQSGKFLTTDGTDASWASISQVPSQSGQSGKFLTTDGTDASWGSIPSDSSKANTDLSNLTSIGKNIGNWSNNITNCIVEVPQDINLTLSSGTLTLKAGSKVYFPNGTGVFDIYTLDTDRTLTFAVNGAYNICLSPSKGLDITESRYTYSGDAQPTGIGQYSMWYDTANNLIKKTGNGGSTWGSGYSLPIAHVTCSGGAISSIDQIFNGCGYIGSHVFFLPGYSVLTPNGRNSDGTLNNRGYTFQSVATFTRNLTGTNIPLWVSYNGSIGMSTGISYDPITNQSVTVEGWAQVGTVDLAAGVISNFKTKTAFHAVDYSDAVSTFASKSELSDFVTKSTNQDITGLKTIVKTEGSVFLEEKASDASFDTAPTTAKYNTLLRLIDSSGKLMGYLEYARFDDGSHRISLVDKKNGTTSSYAVLGVGWDANGNTYSTAPTPTNAKDNSDRIPTTSWVRNHCCTTAATTTSTASKDAPAYIIENYINGASWYRLWSDGWCEQGGHYDKGSLAIDTATTIQLLKAYPNINYTLVAQSSRNDNQGGGINNQVFINYRATTEFKARCYGDGTSQYIDWYACGYTS